MLKEQTINLLGKGKEHAKPASFIAMMTGTSPREVRRAIAELRKEYPIVCLLDGSGYYLAEELSDLKAQRALDISRAQKLLARVQILDKAIEKAESRQMKIKPEEDNE